MGIFVRLSLVACLSLLPSLAIGHDFRGLRHSSLHTDAAAQARKEFAFAMLRQNIESKSHSDMHVLARTDARTFGFTFFLDAWNPGTELKLCFFPDRKFKWFEGARVIVMKLYGEILKHTTLTASDVGLCSDSQADIRIVFANKDGDWSVVGKIEAGNTKSGQPTMGLDTLEKQGPTPDALGLVRHEILHSLGFQHEHQRPDVDCKFKSTKSIARLLGWKVADVEDNFDRMDPRTICKDSADQCSFLTRFDAKSVMLYQLEPAYFRDGKKSPCFIAKQNNDLSDLDIKTLEALYPKVSSVTR
jgi:hypothetical protein